MQMYVNLDQILLFSLFYSRLLADFKGFIQKIVPMAEFEPT